VDRTPGDGGETPSSADVDGTDRADGADGGERAWWRLAGPGGVSLTAKAHVSVAPLPLDGVRLTDGFWAERQRVNRDTTIPAVTAGLEEAGNFENFEVLAGRREGTHKGPGHRDSEVYKWLEALAWERGRDDSPALQKLLDDVTVLLAAGQSPDGYLNSYYGTRPAVERFADLGWGHEIFNLGHLIQAGIAQYRVSGDARLVDIAIRFADYLVATFGPGKREGVDGHPGIEMALVELYRHCGSEEYLQLAQYFVEIRGIAPNDTRLAPAVFQVRYPVRETRSLFGHAVRALYLGAGATDLAIETGDSELLEVLEHQWADMVATKTYITGGFGSRWHIEAFGDAFELPSDRAYCETCAAIGGVLWSWRLLLATGKACYAGLIERILFNAVLPGVSLDGERFFYVNPLQLRQVDDGMSAVTAGRGRQPWFDTACCPTNMVRFVSSIEQYFWTSSERGLQLQQFAPCIVSLRRGEKLLKLEVETGYPWDGNVHITVLSSPKAAWELSLRIPEWCKESRVVVNGSERVVNERSGSYVTLDRSWKEGDQVTLELAMRNRRTCATRDVDAVYGCSAIERGPLVYCIEQADCPPGVKLARVRLVGDDDVVVPGDAVLEGTLALRVPIVAAADTSSDVGLPYGEHVGAEEYGPPAFMKAIPYFAWANRGVGPMRVWIPRTESP
jgi:uncharacterized protein